MVLTAGYCDTEVYSLQKVIRAYCVGKIFKFVPVCVWCVMIVNYINSLIKGRSKITDGDYYVMSCCSFVIVFCYNLYETMSLLHVTNII